MDKYFPFNYIPKKMDPKIKNSIIIIISSQILTLFIFIYIMMKKHSKLGKNKGKGRMNLGNRKDSEARKNSLVEEEKKKSINEVDEVKEEKKENPAPAKKSGKRRKK